VPEAVVETEGDGCMMMAVKNHSWEPVVLEEGYVLV